MPKNIYKLILLVIFAFTANGAKALTADFNADVVAGCSPLVVHFTNTSSGATSYYWDLGNGTYSTLTNVSGSYITPGTYTCTLTAYNGSSSTTHTLTITVYPSPTVSFYASDTAVCPGSGVTFTSTSIPGVSGSVTNLWNFGDGVTVTAASPTHVYTTPGYYNVTLIVTNSMGCSSTLTMATYIHVRNRPTVGFGASTSSFCHAPGTVNFTNTSTGAGTLTYLWYFGDGGTSTSNTPSHTYTTPGVYTVKLIVTDANGCIDSISRPAFVYVGSVTTSFTCPDTVCLGSLATFYNTSSTHVSSSWNFGDGSPAGVTDTGYHNYTTPGTFNVRLVVFNGYCRDTAYRTIVVLPHATASFSYAPVAPCPAPTPITFTGTVPSGSTVTWLYGDGSSGSGTTSTHTYSSNGFDTVKMIVTNSHGCKDTVTRVLAIYDLYMEILADTIKGCKPLTVHFNTRMHSLVPVYGTYPFPGVSYSWTFGDGGTSTSPTPTHTFTAVGTYTVSCTIVTSNGCTVTNTLIIKVGEPPVITFTGSPHRICYGDSVVFTGSVVSGTVDSWKWEYGDGETATTGAPSSTHYYLLPGFFTATVTGYYNGCPSDTVIRGVFTVDSPKAIPNVIYLCSPYHAVRFEDSSMGDDTHIWIFGDGTTSTADTVTHFFAPLSIDTVLLATYNATSGCRDTAKMILDLIPPIPSMAASDSEACPGAIITLTPSVTGGFASAYYWWIDGVLVDNDTGRLFTDTFTTPGHYIVKLGVRDNHHCVDTVSSSLITIGQPVDSFVATPVIGCAPLIVTFTDYSTDVSGVSISSYRWMWGDGTSTVTTTPSTTHTYTAAGTYSISSLVTDRIGCTDTFERPSYITTWRPHAVFTSSTTFPCIGAPVHFTNVSSSVVSSFWMFGDGDTSYSTNPDHSYRAVGTYTVKLVVFDSHGCTDTATYVNLLSVTKPVAAFHMDDSFTICPPLPVHFYNTSTAATSYIWDFGDGSSSVVTSPNNIYISSGSYTVQLVAVNSHGCRDTTYGNVIVYGYAGAFSYTPLSGCAPLLVHFTASLSNIPSIVWDFADGNTSSTSYSDTISHTYILPGAYVPKLILSDGTGCQNSSLGIDTIKVNGIVPGFTSVPHPVCVNTDLHFTDTSHSFFSHDTAWIWVLAPGDTSFLPSPAYHYSVTGTYPVTLTVYDAWGCTATVTQNVDVNPPPTIYTSPDTTVCVGDTAALHGYGGVSYVWSPASVLGCATCQTAFATPVVISTYTVIGTDANGCKNTDTVTVYLRTTTESRAWGDTEVCRNDGVPLFDTGGTKYTWIPAAGLNNSTIYNPIATPGSTTTYMVIAKLAGCLPDTNYVFVKVHQLPTVDAGIDQKLLVGQHAQFIATGTGIKRYLWTPAQTLSCDTCYNPIATTIKNTTYTVVVTSDFGCKASDSVSIFFTCSESQIFIPNTFTPNGDGENDKFYPRGTGVSVVKAFRIYNRWGELMFERENIQLNDVANAWDGTYQGQIARPDVYVYLVEAICSTGEPLFLKGSITVVK